MHPANFRCPGMLVMSAPIQASTKNVISDATRLYLAPLVALFITWLALHRLLRSDLRRQLADQPNHRSLHQTVIPRIGGLGLLAGMTGAALLIGFKAPWLPGVWLACLALTAVSLFDDARGLPAWLRLPIHLAIAAGFVLQWPLSAATLILLTLGLTWATNLYNFMDGSDGLAGGMALFGFGAYAALFGYTSHWPPGAAASAAIALAALAFLSFNFHPARLFMGDSGSIPLGFAAGALGLVGVLEGGWSPLTPVIVFFPFAFDATLTLLRRLLAGKRVWQAHREHLYQRAILAGLGHRNLALCAYGIMFVCALLGFFSAERPLPVAGLIIMAQIVIGLVLAWRVDRYSKPRTPAA